MRHNPSYGIMAKIVDARSPAMPAITLMRAQADLLAGTREIVACAAIGQPCSVAGHEERVHGAPQQPVAFGGIVDELRHDRRVEREQSFLTKLPTPHVQHAVLDVEVATVERKRLANPALPHKVWVVGVANRGF